jgi:hypothetical protein
VADREDELAAWRAWTENQARTEKRNEVRASLAGSRNAQEHRVRLLRKTAESGPLAVTAENRRSIEALQEQGLLDGERHLTARGVEALRHLLPAGVPLPHDPYARIEHMPDEPGVYVIQQGVGGPVKIGKANSIRRRVWELQICSGYPLDLLARFPGAYREETSLQRRFDIYRIHGDWFAPADVLISVVKRVRTVDEAWEILDAEEKTKRGGRRS